MLGLEKDVVVSGHSIGHLIVQAYSVLPVITFLESTLSSAPGYQMERTKISLCFGLWTEAKDWNQHAAV